MKFDSEYLARDYYTKSMISFQSDGVKFPEINIEKTARWLTQVASEYNRTIGNLTYKFCSDEEILRTNRQFLDHDYYTDIITFDYSIGKKVGADIFISLDTVRSNSEELGCDYNTELHRVIVHGLLHLCGIADKTPEQRREMEEAENRALKLYEI